MKKYLAFLLILTAQAVAEDSVPKNTVLPDRDILLSRFDKLGIVKSNAWHEGKLIEGKPVLTTRDGGDLYMMNNKSLSSMSITEGDKPHEEAIHAASICFNIAYVATNTKSKNVTQAVTDIIEEAANDKSGSSGDLINGYWFTVDIKHIDKFPMLVCEVSGFTRWD
ncbi:TPA: hypothetical protein L7673_001811 [Klebsiella pneumoniae subsp. pneumoniae]|nr:hypothetical protein [Klebsiella pneumoniae subsp. pneumoniae]